MKLLKALILTLIAVHLPGCCYTSAQVRTIGLTQYSGQKWLEDKDHNRPTQCDFIVKKYEVSSSHGFVTLDNIYPYSKLNKSGKYDYIPGTVYLDAIKKTDNETKVPVDIQGERYICSIDLSVGNDGTGREIMFVTSDSQRSIFGYLAQSLYIISVPIDIAIGAVILPIYIPLSLILG